MEQAYSLQILSTSKINPEHNITNQYRKTMICEKEQKLRELRLGEKGSKSVFSLPHIYPRQGILETSNLELPIGIDKISSNKSLPLEKNQEYGSLQQRTF